MNVLKPHLQTTIRTLLEAGATQREIDSDVHDDIAVRAAPDLHRGAAALQAQCHAVHQDLVDQFGFAGHYNSVKRFVARLKMREPEQLDRPEFAPGEEMPANLSSVLWEAYDGAIADQPILKQIAIHALHRPNIEAPTFVAKPMDERHRRETHPLPTLVTDHEKHGMPKHSDDKMPPPGSGHLCIRK